MCTGESGSGSRDFLINTELKQASRSARLVKFRVYNRTELDRQPGPE